MTRRGFVLPTVLFGLLLLAGVITGAWVAAFQSVRSAREALAETRTRAAAGGAIAEILAQWDAARFDSLAVGSVDSFAAVYPDIDTRIEVRRTSDNTFALYSRARDSLVGGAERALLAFAKLKPLVPLPHAVVRLRTAPSSDVEAAISGADAPLAGWNCGALGDNIMTLTIQLSGSDAEFWDSGNGWTWPQLVNWVISLPAGGDSLPWRFHAGDLVLSGERFLGVLVVDGNLTLRGGAIINGIVIVRGAIAFEWLGAAISGRVVAREMRIASGVNPASVRMQHSSCAVSLAARSRAPAKALPGVTWADVF